MTVEECVDNGITLLDEHDPNWRERVDVEDLQISSPSRCVLGQLFCGSYTDGLRLLGIHGNEAAIEHGFETGSNSYMELQAMWEKHLT